MPRRKNQNLTPDEARIKRAIAAYHGYTQSRGRGAKVEGSALALDLALITGDAIVVSIDPDDRQVLAVWLATLTPPAHLAELVEALAAELAYGLEAEAPRPPSPPATDGSINTLEG